jgi:membrane-bound lytic murein transglycosylase D
MAIKGRFFIRATVFLALLAPGAFAPNAIASPWPDGLAGVTEHAALPPPADETLRPDLLVEQWLDAVGSVAEQEAASETEPAGVDPWADAFAESSRAAAVTVTVRASAYPLAVNPQVQFFLDRFTGARRDVVTLWVGRSGRYLGMIREVLRSRGLPEELAFTAMIESGFNPLAVSRAGAKGLWQFMAATARRYGLRVDQWVDERLDPEKATGAAAAYFRDLHGIFGSWTLAQAAYNAGEMKVIRALRSTGAKDFWPLTSTAHLRRETKDFVPQIQAATLIGRDPARYGFDLKEPEGVPITRVSAPAATDLRTLATAAGLSAESLRALNPVLLKGITPPGAPYEVRVPAENRDAVLTALAPRPRATLVAQGGGGSATRAAGAPSIHVVRPRDTINSIAKRYGMSAGDILRLNSLERHDSIRPGDRLRVAGPR